MWQSRTKTDLIIEVWEALDCESVGAHEIAEIHKAVGEILGAQAVDTPMVTARLLADEGAVLRHSEVMQLHIEQFEASDHTAIFRNLVKLKTLKEAEATIRNMENIRRKFLGDDDRDGLRVLRDKAIEAGKTATDRAANHRFEPDERQMNREIAEWLRVWLQTPEVFESWLVLRRRSPDFTAKFGAEATK